MHSLLKYPNDILHIICEYICRIERTHEPRDVNIHGMSVAVINRTSNISTSNISTSIGSTSIGSTSIGSTSIGSTSIGISNNYIPGAVKSGDITASIVTSGVTAYNSNVSSRFLKTPHANSTIANFARTCKRIRDLIYRRIIKTIFNHRGWLHVCWNNLTQYYTIAGITTTPRYFEHAIRLHSPIVCKYIIDGLATKSPQDNKMFILSAATGVDGRTVMERDDIAVMLMNLDEIFVAKAWLYVRSVDHHNLRLHKRSSDTLYSQIRCIFAARAERYPNLILEGATRSMYQCIIAHADVRLAFELLLENIHDLSKYIPAMKILFNIIISNVSSYIPHPWLCEDTPMILLIHTMFNCHTYKKDWLLSLIETIPPAYQTYLSVTYDLGAKLSGTIDEHTMQYYLDNTVVKRKEDKVNELLYQNIEHAVGGNVKLYDCILSRIPITLFNIEQLYGIACILINSRLYFDNLFKIPYVNPPLWCSDQQIGIDVREECLKLNLSEDECAIISLYAREEAEKHRQLVHILLSFDTLITIRTDVLSIWYYSRKSEAWLPTTCIEKYLRERENSELEQIAIDQEQAQIQLNRSHDMYDVVEWYHDPLDDE